MFSKIQHTNSLEGIKNIDGRWLVNGRSFNQMNAFEKRRLAIYIAEHKTI
ncbi:hypothetical protein QBK95_03400 [Aquimarina sp. 2201CG14-23]|nr:hypothetical protein [Aquimarina sp. 2201CG14-23]